MTLQEIGILYKHRNNIAEALKFLEESYQLSLKIGNKNSQAHVLLRIAGILIDQDDLDEAEEKLTTTLELLNTIRSPERHALALREMGRLQIKRENYLAGVDFLRQALEKCSSIADVFLRASIFKLLGQALSLLGEVDIAIKHLTESLNIYQKLDSTKEVEEVKSLIQDARLWEPAQLYQAAVAEAQKDNSRAALNLFEQALPLFEQLGEEEIRVTILLSMEALLIGEEDYQKGLERASQVIELAKTGKEEIEGIVLAAQYENLNYLSSTIQRKFESQELDEAVYIAHYCLRLAEILGNDHWCSETLAMIGQIKVHQGDYEGGIQNLNKAVALAQENQFDGIDKLRQIIFTVNNHEATRLYEQAYSAAQQRNLEEAIKLAQKAYEFQCSVNSKNVQPATLGLLGQLLLADNQSEEGLKKLRQALDVAQELQAQEIINQLQEMIYASTKRIEDQDAGEE